VPLADGFDLGEVLLGRTDEPALTQHRLGEHGGYLVGFHVVLERIFEQVRAGHAAGRILESERAPVAVRVGQTIDLGREGTEAFLVGHGLRGQGHGQKGAAVEGVFEGYDGVAAGAVAGDLDGVLDRLGPRVGEHGLLERGARGGRVHLLGQLDVGFVHDYVETGVREQAGLIAHCRDHLGVTVTHCHHADA
jgi:hypothetical protein